MRFLEPAPSQTVSSGVPCRLHCHTASPDVRGVWRVSSLGPFPASGPPVQRAVLPFHTVSAGGEAIRCQLPAWMRPQNEAAPAGAAPPLCPGVCCVRLNRWHLQAALGLFYPPGAKDAPGISLVFRQWERGRPRPQSATVPAAVVPDCWRVPAKDRGYAADLPAAAWVLGGQRQAGQGRSVYPG